MIENVLKELDALYPWDGRSFLEYVEPWQLLFATVLSAQCTDAQVNSVTKGLYARFPTLDAFAQADIAALEDAVRPTGFFHVKARHIQECARLLLARHGGTLPCGMGELTALPGVGRKTANLVRGHVFGLPGIVVDTHVKRVAFRLGLTRQTDPTRVEYDLMAVLPESHWIRFNQQVIAHGRAVCAARKPKCAGCRLFPWCEQKGVV